MSTSYCQLSRMTNWCHISVPGRATCRLRKCLRAATWERYVRCLHMCRWAVSGPVLRPIAGASRTSWRQVENLQSLYHWISGTLRFFHFRCTFSAVPRTLIALHITGCRWCVAILLETVDGRASITQFFPEAFHLIQSPGRCTLIILTEREPKFSQPFGFLRVR